MPETKRAKNRVHFDLVDPDTKAVEGFVDLGASVVGTHQLAGHSWTVMQDPEGSEFCIATKSWTG